MTTAPDPIEPADRELIIALAARIGMTEWPAPPGTLVSVGDAETFYELTADDGQVTFVEVQRGYRSPRARFPSVADAVRFLILRLGGADPGPGDRVEHVHPHV